MILVPTNSGFADSSVFFPCCRALLSVALLDYNLVVVLLVLVFDLAFAAFTLTSALTTACTLSANPEPRTSDRSFDRPTLRCSLIVIAFTVASPG